jgi:hypothetical protein
VSKFYEVIESNLIFILDEINCQPGIGTQFPDDQIDFNDYIIQLREYIEDVAEYGIAYESIVATLQQYPFLLSGIATVKLLEVGLLFGYKTDLPEDEKFNRR